MGNLMIDQWRVPVRAAETRSGNASRRPRCQSPSSPRTAAGGGSFRWTTIEASSISSSLADKPDCCLLRRLSPPACAALAIWLTCPRKPALVALCRIFSFEEMPWSPAAPFQNLHPSAFAEVRLARSAKRRHICLSASRRALPDRLW
jgi:hypothetical protein